MGRNGTSRVRQGSVVSSRLIKAAHIAVSEVLAVHAGEEVLIVTNLDGGEAFAIARAFYDAVRAAGGRPVMMVCPAKTMSDDMDRLVVNAMNAEPDVFIRVSSGTGGQDPYGVAIGYVCRDGRKYALPQIKVIRGDRRVRGFWSGGATLDMFERCVPVDYATMRVQGERLKAIMDKGKKVHIISPAGSDFTVSIAGRKAQVDAGDFTRPGLGGNLPCGEVFISPAGCDGTIVFDGTLTLVSGDLLPEEPVTVTVKDGYVTDVRGGAAELLLTSIAYGEKLAHKKDDETAARNARHIGELGIGLNPAAQVCDRIIESEKSRGTIHLAIGMDCDGLADAYIHLDCLVLEPSVWVDSRQIMRDGDLLI